MNDAEKEYREKIRDDDMIAANVAREMTAKLETRFCRDCRWCSGGEGFERCGSPHNTNSIVDLVTGKARPSISFCSSQRDSALNPNTVCGREGRWFELKTD